MSAQPPEFEVRFQGHVLVKVDRQKLVVTGRDYERDVAALSRLITLLSDVVAESSFAKPQESHGVVVPFIRRKQGR